MKPSLQRRAAPILYVVIFFTGFFTACLWFNPQDYLDNLAPTLTALAAVAMLWLLYVFLSAKNEARHELLRREKLVQQESIHPVLHASIHRVDEQPEMLVLAVRNYGKGMAQKVRMRAEALPDNEASQTVAAAMAQLPVFVQGLDKLAAGESYGGIFADSDILAASLPDGLFGGVIKLTVDCENAFGDMCTSETVLDLTLLNTVGKKAADNRPRKKLLY